MKLEVEIYVRSLVRGFKLSHPALRNYRERVGQLLTENKVFTYQTAMAFAALKFRHVDVDHVKVDDKNSELGTIDAQKVAKNEIMIGLPMLIMADLQNPIITETLIVNLYQFANAEHNELSYLTTKERDTASEPKKEPEDPKGDAQNK